MKLLVIQQNLEKTINQLEYAMRKNPAVDLVIFPEGYLNENVA
jgi:predicted amidohydrolase